MKLENVDGYTFDFTDAINAFVFDEKDTTKNTFHGQPMKAVDIVVELQDAYLFIEIKKYDDIEEFNILTATDDEELRKRQDGFKWLKNYLKYKYRDTYLYRYAEDKLDKPIHFICLLNFEHAMNRALWKVLNKELPVGKASKRWKREIAASCQVLNLEKWNHNFPKWPASCKTGGVA